MSSPLDATSVAIRIENNPYLNDVNVYSRKDY